MELRYTKDIPADFETKWHAMCDRNNWMWKDLLQVCMSESAVSSKAHNDNPKNLPPEQRYNAVGLIQFMPDTLKQLGFEPNPDQAARGLNRWQAMLELSATEQIPWVEKYFQPWKRFGLNSAARFYQATFLPGTLTLGSDSSTVISAKGGRNGFAYLPNMSFDANGDGIITVGELQEAIDRNCRGPRWAEIMARFVGRYEDVLIDVDDLSTIGGQQAALKRLGLYGGEVDGMWGPHTQMALEEFQDHYDLTPDGVFGPLTKAALEKAMAAYHEEESKGA